MSKTNRKKKREARTMPVEEVKVTHYCKDCKGYSHPKCTPNDTFTPRKGTCGEWGGK